MLKTRWMQYRQRVEPSSASSRLRASSRASTPRRSAPNSSAGSASRVCRTSSCALCTAGYTWAYTVLKPSSRASTPRRSATNSSAGSASRACRNSSCTPCASGAPRLQPTLFQTPAWHAQPTPCVSYVQHGDTPTEMRSSERLAAAVFLRRQNASCRKVKDRATRSMNDHA